jgi:hypothetical protein
MGLGNAVLFFSAILIAQRREGDFLSELDALYGSAIFSLLMFRYIDIKFLNGSTSTGEPATMAHWKRYAGSMLVGTLAVWGLVHWIQIYFSR